MRRFGVMSVLGTPFTDRPVMVEPAALKDAEEPVATVCATARTATARTTPFNTLTLAASASLTCLASAGEAVIWLVLNVLRMSAVRTVPSAGIFTPRSSACWLLLPTPDWEDETGTSVVSRLSRETATWAPKALWFAWAPAGLGAGTPVMQRVFEGMGVPPFWSGLAIVAVLQTWHPTVFRTVTVRVTDPLVPAATVPVQVTWLTGDPLG